MSKLVNKLGSFTPVPNAFIKSPDVSHEAFRLFVVLIMHTNGADDTAVAFPSYERLKMLAQVNSFSTIAKSLRLLEKLGWIERKRRFSDTTLYTITSPTPGVVMGDSPTRRVAPSPTPGVGKQEPSAVVELNDDEKREVAEKLSLLGIEQPTRDKLTQQLAYVPMFDFINVWERMRSERLASQSGEKGAPEIGNWAGYAVNTFRALAGVRK